MNRALDKSWGETSSLLDSWLTRFIDIWNKEVVGIYSSIVVTQTYTIVSKDYLVIGNNAATAFTVTFPPAARYAGKVLTVKNKGVANVTIDATNSGQFFTTVAANTLVLATGDCYKVASDGETWNVI